MSSSCLQETEGTPLYTEVLLCTGFMDLISFEPENNLQDRHLISLSQRGIRRRHREVRCFAQGCTARKQQGRDWNLELFPLEQRASGPGMVPSTWVGLMLHACSIRAGNRGRGGETRNHPIHSC